MGRLGAFFVLALACVSLVSLPLLASAASTAECPKACMPPYSKLGPNNDCLRMCQACLNATSAGCSSYFLPYFYGEQYSKHFACWETCPMPAWAWALIGAAIGSMVLMLCCCVYCCAVRRRQNRAAAMAMYQQQLAEHYPHINSSSSSSVPTPGSAAKSAANTGGPVQAPAQAQGVSGPATGGPVSGVPLVPPRLLYGLSKDKFAQAGFAMPSRSSRAGPTYARLDHADQAGQGADSNPYSSTRR